MAIFMNFPLEQFDLANLFNFNSLNFDLIINSGLIIILLVFIVNNKLLSIKDLILMSGKTVKEVLDITTKIVSTAAGSTILYNNWIKDDSSDNNKDDDNKKDNKNNKNENKDKTKDNTSNNKDEATK
jgi:hypothetical protein